jgi:RNA polymerase sigma factor (TIGR02999 family)
VHCSAIVKRYKQIQLLLNVALVQRPRVPDAPLTLQDIDPSEPKAAEKLLRLVYGELRQLAAAKMARESAQHTLQPTALVHEAWLRLGGDRQPTWQNRAHFFGAAAEAMRRILIDRARRRYAEKHGGHCERTNIDDLEIAAEFAVDDEQLIQVHETLEKFSTVEPRKAELVKLRYFAGFTLEEASEVLGIPEGTAKRWWTYARAWLTREMKR